MKFKFFSWLLAVLTVGAFTSSASAATCSYNAGLACSMGSTVTGATFGCSKSNDIAYNGECLRNCSECSSGYSLQPQTYTDGNNNCTIVYNVCVKNTSSACPTTDYSGVLGFDRNVLSSGAYCDNSILNTEYRCTNSGECVRDCKACKDGYSLVDKVVEDSSGTCTMTYKGCDVGKACTSNLDCNSDTIWMPYKITGVQLRTIEECVSRLCVQKTEYRCAPGYAGTVNESGTSSCTQCTEGYYSEGGTTVCAACPDGSYTNKSQGATACVSCKTETGDERATSDAPAVTSEKCYIPIETVIGEDATGTKMLLENCYYEAGPITEIGGGTIVL